jgi:hypothetical protein
MTVTYHRQVVDSARGLGSADSVSGRSPDHEVQVMRLSPIHRSHEGLNRSSAL